LGVVNISSPPSYASFLEPGNPIDWLLHFIYTVFISSMANESQPPNPALIVSFASPSPGRGEAAALILRPTGRASLSIPVTTFKKT
jgi:hypothetical protein